MRFDLHTFEYVQIKRSSCFYKSDQPVPLRWLDSSSSLHRFQVSELHPGSTFSSFHHLTVALCLVSKQQQHPPVRVTVQSTPSLSRQTTSPRGTQGSLADHSLCPLISTSSSLSSPPPISPDSPLRMQSSLFHFLPSAASSLPSDRISDPTNRANAQVVDDERCLSTTPTVHPSTRKPPTIPRAPTMIVKSPSSPISDVLPTSRTPRLSLSKRTPALLSFRASSPIPLPRSRSRSSTHSSSSSGSDPQSSQQHGMGRKVAASLDLFRETTSADELDVLDQPSMPLASSTRRRVSSKHHPQSRAEPEFSFFKRSEWLDRETVVARREQSSGTRDRARTRDGSYPTSVSRSAADVQRRKDRSHSVRENVINDLVHWRTNVLGDPYQDRGRPRERSLDPDHQPSDPVDRQGLRRNEASAFRHPRDFQYSPSSPSPASLLTSPIVPSAIIADSPLSHQDALPSANVPNSPYATEDEDDESSNWEDETASDYGTTASTSSPWPRSPLQMSVSLSPMVKPSVHHDDHDQDGEDEDAGLVMPSRVHQRAVPPELSDFPPYLSNFHDDDVEDAPGHESLSRRHSDLSQESLPHIPLRPFRNQVGGHSAIYKFTKRAVCKVRSLTHLSNHHNLSDRLVSRSFTKPLVSRENIFYEAVEREAPPLLGYIPRYLGVMLVTYRRVKSSEHSPTSSDDRRLRPAMHKAHTIASLEPTLINNQLVSDGPTVAPRGVAELISSFTEDDGGDTETELPEVALDRNTHIVPRWLLNHNQTDRRRLRSASMSHSHSTLPSDARPYPLQGSGPSTMARRKFGDATTSTPDLSVETRFCPQPSPLSMHSTLQSVAPTPDNSPRIFGRLLNTLGEQDHRTASAPPMTPNGLNQIGQKPLCGFGGTGSTVVNTKLKDHIFSTILKGMTKRHRLPAGRRWRVDEEGDAADTEGETCTSPKKRSIVTANDLLAIEDTRSHGDPPSPRYGDIFHMELDSAEEDVHMKEALGSSFLPLARKRSRSRSLGHGTRMSTLPSRSSLGNSRRRCDSKTPVPPSREVPTDPTSAPPNVEPCPTGTAPSSPRQNHFILMEDLTGKLKKPCVLDLKMGTRQYGMDATPGKKKSQRKKCDRTTSRSLGVRVCGMQVSWTRLLYIPGIGDFLFAELPHLY